MFALRAHQPVRFTAARFYATVKANLLEGNSLVNANGDKLSRKDVFENKKVVLFGLPGAFTPVCSSRHVPGYMEKAKELKSKGVDEILCVYVSS